MAEKDDEAVARLNIGEGALVLTRDRVVFTHEAPLRSGKRVVPLRNVTGIAYGEEGSAWFLIGGAIVGILFIMGLLGVPLGNASDGLAIAANALTGIVMFGLFAAFFLVKERWIEVTAPGTRVRASMFGLERGTMETFVDSSLTVWENASQA